MPNAPLFLPTVKAVTLPAANYANAFRELDDWAARQSPGTKILSIGLIDDPNGECLGVIVAYTERRRGREMSIPVNTRRPIARRGRNYRVDISDLLPTARLIAAELGPRLRRDPLIEELRARGLSVGGRRRAAIYDAVLTEQNGSS